MLKPRPQGSPTFRSRSQYRYLEYPEFPRRRGRSGNTIGSGGSIASALGNENTSFATGWPMRRPIAKSEEDWSTGFAKCITSESSAGTVENQNGSDLIPGDEPVLARFGKAHDGLRRLPTWLHPAGCSRLHRIVIAVDEDRERL